MNKGVLGLFVIIPVTLDERVEREYGNLSDYTYWFGNFFISYKFRRSVVTLVMRIFPYSCLVRVNK